MSAAESAVNASYSVSSLVQDKYVGLALAVTGSIAIGTSMIVTKLGLTDAGKRAGLVNRDGPIDSKEFLRNPIWWAGMITMAVGEIANFAAYAFAPPVLVTPLGALSVLIGAVLAAIFLKEELGRIGIVGCGLCLLGSVVIVLHAPEDKDIQTVDEILSYAMSPGFMLYATFAVGFSLWMIYKVAPTHGTKTPLVYLSICSLTGSISVMAIKGLGVGLKLTFAGNNQLTHLPTYIFGIVTAVCIATQMNYFNKALDTFSTNVVNPIYYVFFSSATILASMFLFQGLNTSGGVNTVSLLCGFITTFLGVYLLNLSRSIPSGQNLPEDGGRHRRRVSHSVLESGILNPRISISSETQMGEHSRSFEFSQEDEDAYPLKRQQQRERDEWQRDRQSNPRSPIAGYNHHQQQPNMNGAYAAVSVHTDSDREPHSANAYRSPKRFSGPPRRSQSDLVFDVGNEEDDDSVDDSGHARSEHGRGSKR